MFAANCSRQMGQIKKKICVRQAHKAQSMLCSPAPCTRKHGHSTGPKEPGFAEMLSGSKEDLLQTTSFIHTIRHRHSTGPKEPGFAENSSGPPNRTWCQRPTSSRHMSIILECHRRKSLWIFLHAKLQSDMLYGSGTTNKIPITFKWGLCCCCCCF